MALNARKKTHDKPQSVQTLQDSMGLGGAKRPGKGTRSQTLGDSMHIGASTSKHSAKIGRNHLRDAMGL